MSSAWKELIKKHSLTQKPQLSQGLANHNEDRELALTYNKLSDLEDDCKRLCKEVPNFEDSANGLQRIEQKISSDMTNSPLFSEFEDENKGLKKLVEDYQSVVYQMGISTGNLTNFHQKTLVEPTKKLTSEFGAISGAIKKRDIALIECLKRQTKVEKLDKLSNTAKVEQTKKAYLEHKEDFDNQNRLLLKELPEFYEQRVEYFQPCVQALVKSQVDYYAESDRLFNDLVITNPCTKTPQEDNLYQDEIERNLAIIKSLSIVTDENFKPVPL